MKNIFSTFLFFLLLCSNCTYSQDVPRVISYQGVLVGADGKPESGTKTLSFTIVNNSGVPHPSGFLHTQTFLLQGGLFYAMLGKPNESNMPFPILEGEWNLQISDGTTTYPIIPLYSSVSALNIADNIVTSAKIKDGEVDLVDLKPGTTIGEILKWDGIKWTRSEDEGLRTVSVNSPITGNGTTADPLEVSIPSSVPVGSIIAYWGNTPPEGWLLCDSSIIPSQYQSLIVFLGSTRTPDLRGMFLRGANTTINSSSKGNNGDPDEGSRIGGIGVSRIGSRQPDAFQIHNHTISTKTQGGVVQNYIAAPGTWTDTGGMAATHDNGTSFETRPKNVYVNYIIKAR